MMQQCRDRRGDRFGSLVAFEATHRVLSSGRRMPAWKLRCDCGNTVVAMTVNLTKGKHQSCGCQKAKLNALAKPGDTKNPEYRVYRQMLNRCSLPTAPNYRYYGGKGVDVCARWRFGAEGKTGFQTFLADMGPRPDGLTLDRIDPFGDYKPDNCRWATWATQSTNRRKSAHKPDAGF
jgi:hypothetical protein